MRLRRPRRHEKAGNNLGRRRFVKGNTVWIFQIAQNLTVSNAAIVTLSGGAQAKNVFWQVAGQATLGTTSDFKGHSMPRPLRSRSFF
jgi:ice-binding like protein